MFSSWDERRIMGAVRSDSTGRSRLAVSCDPVFYPDVIISLLITTNEVNVIGCRSLSRELVFTRSYWCSRLHEKCLIAKTLSLFSSVRYCRFLFLFVVLLVFILYFYLHFYCVLPEWQNKHLLFYFIIIVVVSCICYHVMVK